MIEEILRKEREEIKLQKLPPNFYSESMEYIKKLKNDINQKEGFEKKLLQRELKSFKAMFSELINLRINKVIDLRDQNFTPDEEKVFKEISELIKKYKKTLSEETVPRTLKVKLEKDLPVIIGPDLKTYGPFRKDEEVELPVEMGILLIKNRIGIKGE